MLLLEGEPKHFRFTRGIQQIEPTSDPHFILLYSQLPQAHTIISLALYQPLETANTRQAAVPFDEYLFAAAVPFDERLVTVTPLTIRHPSLRSRSVERQPRPS